MTTGAIVISVIFCLLAFRTGIWIQDEIGTKAAIIIPIVVFVLATLFFGVINEQRMLLRGLMYGSTLLGGIYSYIRERRNN